MNIAPKKSLGQNFLINKGVAERIIKAAEINSNDLVIEVGPGRGALTQELQKRAGQVIAIEKDRQLVDELKSKFNYSNIEIIESDVLHISYSIFHTPYKIVANLPYYITSHFLRLMLENWPRPELAVLMVQKEVAQRMMAKPPEMSLLALSVQYYADVEKIMDVSPGSFRPMPSIDSSVIRLRPKSLSLKPDETEFLFKLAKTAFAGKRKQIITTLPDAIGKSKEETAILLAKIGIDPMARPETLGLSDWINLAKGI